MSPFFNSHHHSKDTIHSEVVRSISVIELFAKIMRNSQASDKLIWFHWNSGWFKKKRFSLNFLPFFYNLFSMHWIPSEHDRHSRKIATNHKFCNHSLQFIPLIKINTVEKTLMKHLVQLFAAIFPEKMERK